MPDGATFEGNIYRSVNEGTDPMLIHQGNIDANHRYTKPGIGGQYFSTGEKMVNGELAHYGLSSEGRVMYKFDSKIDNMLDLSNPTVRQKLGVSLEDLTGDSYSVTQRLGKFAKNNGYNGILAPSARADGGLHVITFDTKSINIIK